MGGIQINRCNFNSVSLVDDRLADFVGNVSTGLRSLLYDYFGPVRNRMFEGGNVFLSAGKIDKE